MTVTLGLIHCEIQIVYQHPLRNGRKLGQKPVVYSRFCFIYPLAFKSLLFYVPSGHTGFNLKTSPLKQTTKLTKVVAGRTTEM